MNSQVGTAARGAVPGPEAIPDAAYRQALRELLLRLGDDELVLGHRNSEWTGFAPLIEEDVAFSSLAQDEIGHATLFYDLLAALDGTTADRIAFGRQPEAFRNAVLLERDNGGPQVWDRPRDPDAPPRRDWGFTIARQFLYDVADALRLERLEASSYAPLAHAAALARREERYHLEHSRAWVERLLGAGESSRERMLASLRAAWPGALGLFEETDADPVLERAGIFPGGTTGWRDAWLARMAELNSALQLGLPVQEGMAGAELGGRRGRHSGDLARLLDEMTMVYRLDPEAVW